MSVDAEIFQSYIYRFFKQAGRSDLPWRHDYDPYKILVSEIMLQQTQVERVIPKFIAFLDTFPSVQSLAKASIADVIKQWQGLGYNRRGLNLQKAAQKIISDFSGQVPSDKDNLMSLPGIGPYTATAIQAFAFNQPSLVIETNIRTVFIFHFFHGAYKVDDKVILDLIALTLDTKNPRRWYSALMDYGAHLKQHVPNPTRLSKSYARQSQFEGSNRKVRGAILKQLGLKGKILQAELEILVGESGEKFEHPLKQLLQEGFLIDEGNILRLNDKA